MKVKIWKEYNGLWYFEIDLPGGGDFYHGAYLTLWSAKRGAARWLANLLAELEMVEWRGGCKREGLDLGGSKKIHIAWQNMLAGLEDAE